MTAINNEEFDQAYLEALSQLMATLPTFKQIETAIMNECSDGGNCVFGKACYCTRAAAAVAALLPSCKPPDLVDKLQLAWAILLHSCTPQAMRRMDDVISAVKTDLCKR